MEGLEKEWASLDGSLRDTLEEARARMNDCKQRICISYTLSLSNVGPFTGGSYQP